MIVFNHNSRLIALTLTFSHRKNKGNIPNSSTPLSRSGLFHAVRPWQSLDYTCARVRMVSLSNVIFNKNHTEMSLRISFLWLWDCLTEKHDGSQAMVSENSL